jgi:hypothetical protein
MRRPMLKCTKRFIPHSMEDVQLASCLVAILLLLNLIITHGLNNLFDDELFALFRLDLFSKDNTLPKSMYYVKKVV